jgi:hypothetical protein
LASNPNGIVYQSPRLANANLGYADNENPNPNGVF